MRVPPARSLVAALLLLAPGGPDDVAHTDISIDAPSVAWHRQVEWGVERFRQAGLDLPVVTVTVHDDRAPCDGEDGRFRHGEPAAIDLCSPAEVGSRPARMITLHELAHAWAETQLTDGERRDFLALRSLDVWTDPDVPPHEWGAEHAAEVLSWGLMDERVPIVRIYDAEPDALASAFALLTDA